MRLVFRHPLALLIFALAAGLVSRAPAQYVVTATPAASWGAADSVLGVAGYTIEDFEDTTLVAGLLIGWQTEAGNVVPAATLPNTFNPVTQDPHGTAFIGGEWDGSNVLVNTRTNRTFVYTEVANWGDLVIQFTSPVYSVGFSVQQNDFDIGLSINGSSYNSLVFHTDISPNGGRYAYIRIDALPGNSITSLQLHNGRSSFYDGFVIDHLAFNTVPEPSAALLVGTGLGGLALVHRVGRRRLTSRP